MFLQFRREYHIVSEEEIKCLAVNVSELALAQIKLLYCEGDFFLFFGSKCQFQKHHFDDPSYKSESMKNERVKSYRLKLRRLCYSRFTRLLLCSIAIDRLIVIVSVTMRSCDTWYRYEVRESCDERLE